MLVFIDESGDAGFRLNDGSSPIFVGAMVIFASSEDAASTQEAIFRSAARRNHKGEFKFSRARDDIRDQFFVAVRDCPFTVRAIVVRKDVIYSTQLRTAKESFYEFFVKQLLRFDEGRLSGARVRIDGSGDAAFRRNLATALRKGVRRGAVWDVRFSKSDNDPLIQLADMCAGAIARSYRTDRPNSERWRTMLRPRIDDVLDFR